MASRTCFADGKRSGKKIYEFLKCENETVDMNVSTAAVAAYVQCTESADCTRQNRQNNAKSGRQRGGECAKETEEATAAAAECCVNLCHAVENECIQEKIVEIVVFFSHFLLVY